MREGREELVWACEGSRRGAPRDIAVELFGTSLCNCAGDMREGREELGPGVRARGPVGEHRGTSLYNCVDADTVRDFGARWVRGAVFLPTRAPRKLRRAWTHAYAGRAPTRRPEKKFIDDATS